MACFFLDKLEQLDSGSVKIYYYIRCKILLKMHKVFNRIPLCVEIGTNSKSSALAKAPTSYPDIANIYIFSPPPPILFFSP